MKKLISGLLAGVMCIGLSVVSFAAEETYENGTFMSERAYITFEDVSFKETGTLTIDGKKITTTLYHLKENSTVVSAYKNGMVVMGDLMIYDYINGTSFKSGKKSGAMGPFTISGNALISYRDFFFTANKRPLFEETSTDSTSNNNKEKIGITTIESGNESVTINVTSSEKATLKIDGKSITTTVYYAPKGSKIDIKSSAPMGMGLAMTAYEKSGDNFVAFGGGPVTGAGGASVSEYFSSIKFTDGTFVYYCPDNMKLGGTAAPAKETVKPSTPVTTTTPAKTTTPDISTRGDLVYEVKMDDTFGALALNYFGNMNYWRAIYNYNVDAIEAAPGKQIYEGMELLIPSAIQHKDTIINIIPPAVAGSGEKLYTVQPDDTYGTIAQAHFGDASRYKEIFNRNADRLVDLDTLYAGQIIVLPRK